MFGGVDVEALQEATVEVESMEQAKNYVCTQCSSPVAFGQKFCGTCGAPVPPDVQNGTEAYFNPMQEPGKARLVSIRGAEGTEGLSYELHDQSYYAGSGEAQILFPADPWVSGKHAHFFYDDAGLTVSDEGSTNGVFLRVVGESPIKDGQQFICGEQVFHALQNDAIEPFQAEDETFFYSSPAEPFTFRVVQELEGGLDGLECCAREGRVRIGREECDMNFPEDIYISGEHAELSVKGNGLVITDLGSRNGTYIRVEGKTVLKHNDYLFIGRQLLKVEITA